MLSHLRSALLSVLVLAVAGAARAQTSDQPYCYATNARYNVTQHPKTGYDFIPVTEDDSLGFYVAYSAKQNSTNTGIASTSCMYVLPLVNDEVLVFGGGFGDTWYIPGGAYFNADYDAAFIREIVVACLGRDLSKTHIRFVAPHGHPDHITVAFIKALERAGMSVGAIVYHEGDRAWIEQLPWQSHHPALFDVMRGGICNEEIYSLESPLGHIGFIHRPGHTPGAVDLVLDLLGDPNDRILVQGSASGGCPPPPGVVLTLGAHGTAIIGGPRRAQATVIVGQGINRECLSSETMPKLGSTWVGSVEIGAHPGALLVSIFGTDRVLNPGQITPNGELLVNPLGRMQLTALAPSLGRDRVSITFPIPQDPSLMGRQCFVQSTIVGGGIELCNGLHLVIGF